MRLGIRGRLFVVSLAVIAGAATASGIYLEGELRNAFEARIENELLSNARTARESIEGQTGPIDPLADRLAKASDVRVTIIDARGRVLGDSELDASALTRIDNHGDRPEVKTALSGKVGISRRRSSTLDTRMLYVAIPARVAKTQGSLRMSMPLRTVDEAASRLRALLFFAGALGLAVAIAMSALASHLFSRPLSKLVDRVRKTVRPDAEAPSGGILGVSFNHLADELEQMMTLVAAERQTFEAVLDGMSEAVLSLDAEHRVTQINPAAMTLLGLSASPTGQTLAEATRLTALNELVDEASEEPASASFTLSDGEQARSVIARARPLATGGVAVVMLDVTAMRRLETIRKDFVANVSHELRTPVSVIRATSETLLAGALEDPERAREFVDALHRNAERLSGIIADLLQLSKIESGRTRPNLENVTVGEAIGGALDAVRTTAEERAHRLDAEVDEELNVVADPKALDQVLLNLLVNAMRYTPNGGHIVARARREDGMAKIEIEDDGPGIDPEHRDRVFERFYRIDPSRSRDLGGTGLGLAIVRHLVESMGGKAGHEPATPSGSIFWVTLPLTTPLRQITQAQSQLKLHLAGAPPLRATARNERGPANLRVTKRTGPF